MAAIKKTAGKVDIYSAFLKDLSSGIIQPSQRVGEETLAARWKVSRLPVRDALIRLEAEGIVERRPSSGTYVKQLDLEEFEEIFVLRAAIESSVVRKVVQIATAKQLDDLEKLAVSLDELPPATSDEVIAEREMQFHLRLCKIARMHYASRMLRVQHLLLRSINISLQIPSADADTAVFLHRDIVKALRTRDADFCEAFIRQHIQTACDTKRAYFTAPAESESSQHKADRQPK